MEENKMQSMDTVQPKNRCFIVTVGTSLIDNYSELLDSENKKPNFDTDTLNNSLADSLWNEWKHISSKNSIDNFYKKVYNNIKYYNYQNAYDTIKEWLTSIRNNDLTNLSKVSAEIKTLSKMEPSKERDIVVLFPTLTYAGVLCAKILHDLLSKNYVNNVEVVFTEGLKSAEDKDTSFTKQGLSNFLSNMIECIDRYDEENYEIKILVSGGYKSLVPYSTLVGILKRKDIYYIYEDSDQLMSLPSLPISIDISTLKPCYPILRNIENSLVEKYKIYFNKLPDEIKNLIETKNGQFKFKSALTFLVQSYNSIVNKSPLEFESRNLNLLNFLTEESSSPDLKKYFMDLVDIGSFFWIGDKIPEMIDHALKHHNNLFEIMELILLPILTNKPDFLSEEELFILLCTIYFHDWGHVLSQFPGSRTLLPTEIRDHHNILGYERLKDQRTQEQLLSQLKWSPNKESLWKNYLEAIATVGLYHRKRMPLFSNKDSDYSFKIGSKDYTYKPAGESKIKFNKNEIVEGRLLLLIALFRVIDSLDTQVWRIGSENEFIFKMSSLLSDIKSEKVRAERIKEIIDCDSIISPLIVLLEKIETGYEKADGQPLCIDEGINGIAHNDEKLKSEIFLFLESSLRIFIKKEQFKHYLKHLYLDSPRFEYAFEDPRHIITVTYKKNNKFDETIEKLHQTLDIWANDSELSSDVEEISQEIDEIKGKDTNTVLTSIEADYDKVKDILENGNVYFEFKFQS